MSLYIWKMFHCNSSRGTDPEKRQRSRVCLVPAVFSCSWGSVGWTSWSEHTADWGTTARCFPPLIDYSSAFSCICKWVKLMQMTSNTLTWPPIKFFYKFYETTKTQTDARTHTERDLLSLQHTPATVRILHSDTGVAVGLQVTSLDWNLGDLHTHDRLLLWRSRYCGQHAETWGQ